MKHSAKGRLAIPLLAYLLVCGDMLLTYAMFRTFSGDDFTGYREYNPIVSAVIDWFGLEVALVGIPVVLGGLASVLIFQYWNEWKVLRILGYGFVLTRLAAIIFNLFGMIKLTQE